MGKPRTRARSSRSTTCKLWPTLLPVDIPKERPAYSASQSENLPKVIDTQVISSRDPRLSPGLPPTSVYSRSCLRDSEDDFSDEWDEDGSFRSEDWYCEDVGNEYEDEAKNFKVRIHVNPKFLPHLLGKSSQPTEEEQLSPEALASIRKTLKEKKNDAEEPNEKEQYDSRQKQDGSDVEEKVHSWMKKSQHYFGNSSEDDQSEVVHQKREVIEKSPHREKVTEQMERRKVTLSELKSEVAQTGKLLMKDTDGEKLYISHSKSDDKPTSSCTTQPHISQILVEETSKVPKAAQLRKESRLISDDLNVPLSEEKRKMKIEKKLSGNLTKPVKIAKKYCTDARRDHARQTEKFIFRKGPLEKSPGHTGSRKHASDKDLEQDTSPSRKTTSIPQGIEDEVNPRDGKLAASSKLQTSTSSSYVHDQLIEPHSRNTQRRPLEIREMNRKVIRRPLVVSGGDQERRVLCPTQSRTSTFSHQPPAVTTTLTQNDVFSAPESKSNVKIKPVRDSDTEHEKVLIQLPAPNPIKSDMKKSADTKSVQVEKEQRKIEKKGNTVGAMKTSRNTRPSKIKRVNDVQHRCLAAATVKVDEPHSRKNVPVEKKPCLKRPRLEGLHTMKRRFVPLSPYVRKCMQELFGGEEVDKEMKSQEGNVLTELKSIYQDMERQEANVYHHLDSLSLGTQLESTFAESVMVKRVLLETLKEWMNQRPLELHNMQQVDWTTFPKPKPLKHSHVTDYTVKECQKELQEELDLLLREETETKLTGNTSQVATMVEGTVDQMFRQVKQYMNFLVSKSEKELSQPKVAKSAIIESTTYPRVDTTAKSIVKESDAVCGRVQILSMQSRNAEPVEIPGKILSSSKEVELKPIAEIPLEPRPLAKQGKRLAGENTKELRIQSKSAAGEMDKLFNDFCGNVKQIMTEDKGIADGVRVGKLRKIHHGLQKSDADSKIDQVLREAGDGFSSQLSSLTSCLSSHVPTMVAKPNDNLHSRDRSQEKGFSERHFDSPEISPGDIYSPTRPTETEDHDGYFTSSPTKRKNVEDEGGDVPKKKKGDKEKSKEKGKAKKEKKKEKKEKRKKEKKAEKRAEERTRKRHKSEPLFLEDKGGIKKGESFEVEEQFDRYEEQISIDQPPRHYRGRVYRRSDFKGPFGRYRKSEALTKGRRKYSVSEALHSATFKDSYLSNASDVYNEKPSLNFQPDFDPTIAPYDHFKNPFSLTWAFIEPLLYEKDDLVSYIKSVCPGNAKFNLDGLEPENSYMWALVLAAYRELYVDESVGLKAEEAELSPNGQDTMLNEYGTVVKADSGVKTFAPELLNDEEASTLKNKKTKGNPLMQAFRQALEMKKRSESHHDDQKAKVQKLSPALAAKKPKPRSNRPLFKPPIAVMMERQAKGLDPVHGDGEGLRMFCEDGQETDTQVVEEAVAIDMAPSVPTDATIQQAFTGFREDLLALLKQRYSHEELQVLDKASDPLNCQDTGVKHLPALSSTTSRYYSKLREQKLKVNFSHMESNRHGELNQTQSTLLVGEISLPPEPPVIKPEPVVMSKEILVAQSHLEFFPAEKIPAEPVVVLENSRTEKPHSSMKETDGDKTGWSIVQDSPAKSNLSSVVVEWKSTPPVDVGPGGEPLEQKEMDKQVQETTDSDAAEPPVNSRWLQAFRQAVKSKKNPSASQSSSLDGKKIDAQTLLKRVANKQIKGPTDQHMFTSITSTSTCIPLPDPVLPKTSPLPVELCTATVQQMPIRSPPQTFQQVVSHTPVTAQKYNVSVAGMAQTLVSPTIATVITAIASSTDTTTAVNSITSCTTTVTSTTKAATNVQVSSKITTTEAEAVLPEINKSDAENISVVNMDTSDSETETSVVDKGSDIPEAWTIREAVISQPPTLYKERLAAALASDAPPGTAPLPDMNHPPPPPGEPQHEDTPPPPPPPGTDDELQRPGTLATNPSSGSNPPVNPSLSALAGSNYEHLQRQAQSFAQAKQTHNFTQPPPGYTDPAAFPQSTYQGNYPNPPTGFPPYPPPPMQGSYDPWNHYSSFVHQWQTYYDSWSQQPQRFPTWDQYRGQPPWAAMPPMGSRGLNPWNAPFPPQRAADGTLLPPPAVPTTSQWMAGQRPPVLGPNGQSATNLPSDKDAACSHRMYVFNRDKSICKSIERFLLFMGGSLFDPYNINLLEASQPALAATVMLHTEDKDLLHQLPNLLALKASSHVSFCLYDDVLDIKHHRYTPIMVKGGLLIPDELVLLGIVPENLNAILAFVEKKVAEGIPWSMKLHAGILKQLQDSRLEQPEGAEEHMRLGQVLDTLKMYRERHLVEVLMEHDCDEGSRTKTLPQLLSCCRQQQVKNAAMYRHTILLSDLGDDYHWRPLFTESGVNVLSTAQLMQIHLHEDAQPGVPLTPPNFGRLCSPIYDDAPLTVVWQQLPALLPPEEQLHESNIAVPVVTSEIN